jgi:hypothetical protein
MVPSWREDLRFNDVDSTLKTVGEFALSTTAGENLGLYHSTLPTYNARIDRSDKWLRWANPDRRTRDLVESFNGFLG